jgi:hypothetical protein
MSANANNAGSKSERSKPGPGMQEEQRRCDPASPVHPARTPFRPFTLRRRVPNWVNRIAACAGRGGNGGKAGSWAHTS